MKYLAPILCVVLATFSYQPVYTDENTSQNVPSTSTSLSGDGPSVSASMSPNSPNSSGQEKASGQSMNSGMGSEKNQNSESMGNMGNMGNMGSMENMQHQYQRPVSGLPFVGPLRIPNPVAVVMGQDTYDDTTRLLKNLPLNQLKRTFNAGKAIGLVDPNTDSDRLAGQVYSTTANVATLPIRAPARLWGMGQNFFGSLIGGFRGNSQGYNGYQRQVPARQQFAQAGSNFRGGMQQMGESFGNAGRAVANTARNTASAAVTGTQKVAGSAVNAAENAAKELTGGLSAAASSPQVPSVSVSTNSKKLTETRI
ncbi:uncharacterized protein LOC141854239 [Brevipalpus obovatus]|uniref:uncharacterized protein LOC141854239 n=1 Tax=Brevipalpus obovatus TaxID=246614 RepID=UPI003D9E250E